jgi:hypothetical protein
MVVENENIDPSSDMHLVEVVDSKRRGFCPVSMSHPYSSPLGPLFSEAQPSRLCVCPRRTGSLAKNYVVPTGGRIVRHCDVRGASQKIERWSEKNIKVEAGGAE